VAFDPITLTSIVRDPGTGRIRFEIDFKTKIPAKMPAGAKK
jgi:hypothetical protein